MKKLKIILIFNLFTMFLIVQGSVALRIVIMVEHIVQ
jgi:hypothetical protein